MTTTKRRTGQTSDQATPARKSAAAIIVFIAIAVIGLAADLLSKHYAFSTLMGRPEHSTTVIPGLLKLTLSTNSGIVFGFPAPKWAVLFATAVASIAVIVIFMTSRPVQRMLHSALAMVLAGAIGNAYDRIFSNVTFPGDTAPRLGQVRDFIDVYVLNYPVFNVADILLVIGAAMILLESILDMLRQRKANNS